MAKSNSDFDALWQKAQTEPQVKKITAANKIEANLSIYDLMDRHLEAARAALSQNKISRQVFDEVASQTQSYKSTLSKLEGAGVSVISGIGRQLRSRLFGKRS